MANIEKQTTPEVEVRIALGELGATWEDPEMVIQNVLKIIEAEVQKAREEERNRMYHELERLVANLTDHTKTDKQ